MRISGIQQLLVPWRSQMKMMDNMKNFRLTLDGPHEILGSCIRGLCCYFRCGDSITSNENDI